MWCQCLLTIIAISYLMCVLLLSGLQKEDLDVNMLRKLQRHNVNIDNMNNEDLRHQCLTTSTTDILNHSNSRKTNDSYTELIIEVATETYKNTNSVESDLNKVIKYFINSRKSQDLIKEETGTSPRTQKDTTESIIYSSYSYTNNPVTEINYTRSVSNEKIKLDKIMEAISSITRMRLRDEDIKADITPNPKNIKISTNIDIIKNNINNKRTSDVDYISKIIAEYINTQTTTPTSTYPPTTTTMKLNFDIISQHIESFLKNSAKFENTYPYNALTLNTKPIETGVDQKSHNPDKARNISLQTINIFRNNLDPNEIGKPSYPNNGEYDGTRVKNNAIKYISDILQADQLQQSITQFPFITGTQQETMHNIQNSNTLYTKLEKDNSKKKEEWRTLPSDAIKEIAERVKTIVLKDLQREIFNTTPEVTTTTTTEATKILNNRDQGNLQEATQVIEKFMELFQQFKSIKESTIISGDTKFKMTEQKHVKQQYNGPVKFMYPPMMSPVNPYGTKSKMEPIPPMFINQFNQGLKVNTPIAHNLEIEKQNKVNKLTVLNMFNHKAETPITLQTNSNEIPPLGIPISKPVKLMNQNIIVTTKRPLMKLNNNRQHQDLMQRVGDNHNTHQNTMRNGLPKAYNKFSDRGQESQGFPRQDFRDHRVNMFTNTDRDRPKSRDEYSDRTHYTSHYTPHYDRYDYERMRLRNQQVKRFHERLERVDDRTRNSMDGGRFSDDGENSYQYKVASRQQLSLNDAKSHLKYDDTHFRNFLKTQQKVNDMLERILATKTKSQGPSVEIP